MNNFFIGIYFKYKISQKKCCCHSQVTEEAMANFKTKINRFEKKGELFYD